ncbi:hypothetical protein [Corynebacterium glyciniphilum]|uniref:hypothetical protein n=1 Tax=Corynebacterium glyciniphilum TaxID=1404244 RepID=UPI0011AB4682|nr:hypothetical protein [Corynebacterium glyciniphilum]
MSPVQDIVPLLYTPDEWRRLNELCARIKEHPFRLDTASMIDTVQHGIDRCRPAEEIITTAIDRARFHDVDLNYTIDWSHFVPSSRDGQNILVRANYDGFTTPGRDKDDLVHCGLLTADGEITSLGVRVAHHIEWITWKKDRKDDA